ncbi:MAG: fumarylacetoacetate hydrolase family protein [Pseudomonadota bacterium]
MSYEHDGRVAFGATDGEAVADLSDALPDASDLRGAIRAGALGTLAELAEKRGFSVPLGDVNYLPVIPNPEKIICIGVNYANRNEEYKDGSSLPEYPSVFMRSRESLVGHGQPILDPPESDQLDYEGEIVLIVGKTGRRIPAEAAHEYVAGATIMNEGSLRDWLRHAKFNVTQGKNFANSGSLGPWMVTSDELDPMGKLHVATRVNDEIRQDDTTENLIFDFRYLISYLSSFYVLQPGDIIATGTPNGAGARFDPPKYLRPGDRVDVKVSGIGTLSNRIVAETL